ncbi:MAG: hypothetical protein OEW64_06065 [Gammaproteobacteria bacterium]|nr:hypothetical protein [Gammaproteobacteria bacterium]MDH5303643.1 hypothetical protein [Gammaproteobacteria bacterium]MDH5322327.1 hypothetical protein [Gammaproteobacteria bacterium]
MNQDFFIQHWAVIVAGLLGVTIVLYVLIRLYANSARGRLRQRVRELNAKKRAAWQAEQKLERASRRLENLQKRAAAVKPRILTAADEAVQDARMLKKVADDLVLVAQRKLRDVIIEEFPPNRQDGLRNRYL